MAFRRGVVHWRILDQPVDDAAPQCHSNQAVIATAKALWALTRVLHYRLGPALIAGDPKIILPDYEEELLPIHVMHPEGRHAPAKVRTFVDLAVERLREKQLLN